MVTEIIKREDLVGKEIQDIQTELTQNCTDAAAALATLDIEQLNAEEEELMTIFKENEARMGEVTYTLPESAIFDDVTSKAQDVHKMIIGFLNRLEVEWRAALGIHQAIRFWKTSNDDKIPYAVYDSTLRLLGTLKFKGEKDCFDILTINNFMSAAHRDYVEDNTYLQYLAARHQAIMDAMQKLEKADEGSEQE